jgi:transcriptional regulator of acetoin/glycerol metabolism
MIEPRSVDDGCGGASRLNLRRRWAVRRPQLTMAEAALELGTSRATLYRKIAQYGIQA